MSSRDREIQERIFEGDFEGAQRLHRQGHRRAELIRLAFYAVLTAICIAVIL